MKAIILTDENTLVLQDMPKPEAQAGEVIVKIIAAGFNPIDYQIRENEFERRYLHSPVLGRELAGIVASTGRNTKWLAPGDEVFCSAGSMGSNGTYAEYIALPEEIVALKPKNISFAEVAALPSAGITALQCFNRMNLQAQDRVFISGAAGGVGKMLVNLLKANGFEQFLVTAGNVSSRQALLNIGVGEHQIVDYHSQDLISDLISGNGGKAFDVAVDCVGLQMAELSAQLLKPNGVYLDVTNFHTEASRNALFSKGTTVHNISNFIYAAEQDFGYFRQSLNELCGYVESDRITLNAIDIVGDLSVETVERAHDRMKNNLSFGKKLIMKITHEQN